MREILFRGKHVLDGRWIEGFYNGVRPDLATMQTKECHRILSLKSLAYDVAPDTIGQYTGLTDKNGKKIFEGDILRIRGDKEHPVLVVFHDFGWVCVMKNQKYYRHRIENNSEKYEVIGNIRDNPELMEDK